MIYYEFKQNPRNKETFVQGQSCCIIHELKAMITGEYFNARFVCVLASFFICPLVSYEPLKAFYNVLSS